MFSKVLALFAVVAVGSAVAQHLEAAKYPAGVDPSSCPNYPNCDNAALHNKNQYQQPQQYNQQYNQQYYNPQPQQNYYNPQPQQNYYNPQPQQNYYNPQQYQSLPGPANNHLGAGGDKYPAGVDPSSCPNYPYCDNSVHGGGHAPQAAPLPGFTERLYPAGVSARECPNFPYCS